MSDFSYDTFETSTQPLMEKERIRVTGALNFPSLATLVNGSLTIAVPGAEVGDDVTVHPDAAGGVTAGLILTAYVSAADVVTVRCHNVSASTIDAASATYSVNVWKA